MMNMLLKPWFIDTNAIVKYFIDEKGSELIRWLIDEHVKYGIVLSTSIQVKDEFQAVIFKKVDLKRISSFEANEIISLSKQYFESIFHVTTSEAIARVPVEVSAIMNKYNLDPSKHSVDAKILSCILNRFWFFEESSRTHVITSDHKFQRIIKSEGYIVIDPEGQTKEQIISYIKGLK